MSRLPRDERTPVDASTGFDAVVLQQFVQTGGQDQPLSTSDLTYREVRDALWLARQLHRPEPATPPAPPDDPVPPAATEQDEPDRESPAAAEENKPEPRDITTAPAPPEPPKLAEEENWTPGPANVFPIPVGDGATTNGDSALAWPTVPALSEPRRIAGALRPFMRPAPSPWRRVLDEEATAVRAAQEGLWLPEWRPAPSRQFDVVLVADTAPSMEIWRQTVQDFLVLLQRQGAFRDVRLLRLDCSKASLADLVLRPEGQQERGHHWSDLVDPTGRRIVLVMTDAIGRAWHEGAASELLFRWGRVMPTAVVHVLEQRLWRWGGIATRRVRLCAPAPGSANKDLRVRVVEPDLALDVGDPAAIPVPVLGLSAEWFAGWSRLLTAPGSEWVETTAAMVQPRPDEPVVSTPEEPAEKLTARTRVMRFRTQASVQAFHLAGLLAATPLSLPLIKLVQRIMLPGASLSVLAEVVLGGLLKSVPAKGSSPDPTRVAYEFHDGVREELLSGVRRSDTIRVARMVGQYADRINATLRNFAAALDAPNDTADPTPNAENLPYIRVQEAVFRALSGPYSRRAKRLATSRLRLEYDVPVSIQQLERQAEQEKSSVQLTEPPNVTASTGGAFSAEGEDVTAPEFPLSVEQRREGMSKPQVWGSVPLRNPDFVGRKQLLESLRQRLLEPGATAVLPEALHGMGGVGKSQTVVEYIYQHAAEYDIVWWISAEHPAQITASLVELAKKMGLPTAATADTAIPAVLDALRRGEEPYSRWILVFDNADRPETVRQFFPAGSGHVVVTSRNSEWGNIARPVEVDLFTRAESKQLLNRRGGELTDADADRLAEALGDLPLAIEQAAAWRSQTGMQVSEYLDLLEQNRIELLEAGTSSDYQLPVAAAWNVPLNRLKQEHRAALQLLQVCAFFGPEPISRKLFSGARGTPVPEALAKAFADPIKLNRAVREISRYSLAKIDHRNNTLQLHRLVQTVLKNRLNADEQDVMRHAVHELLVKGDPGDPDSAANWPQYAALLPHATMSKAVNCHDDWVRELMINLVRYLLASGDYGGALDFSEQCISVWRDNLGETNLGTLKMSRWHAIALRRLGKIDQAMELNEKTLGLLRSEVGEDNDAFLSMLDTVAADRRTKGRFTEELELQQQVYERSKIILGETEPDTLYYAANLASCFRIMGDFFRARELDQETLSRRSVVLGEDHILTYRSRNALAMDIRESGDYVAAGKLQEETLEKQKELFGEDHPFTIGAMRNLAVALRKAGDHEGARQQSEQCVALYSRRHGEKHIDTVTSLMCLSADLRLIPDLARSLELAAQSHRLFKDIRGEDHPYTQIAATNLAVTCRLAGDPGRARALNEEAVAKLRELFHNDHPFTMVAATNLASDLAALGEHENAMTLDEDLLARSTEVLGAEHPSTLAVALNLSIDLTNVGRAEDAAILHSTTMAGFRRALGDNHPATLAASQSVRANCDSDTMEL
ncbi:tetratricopeptide repeat protein [Lentzea atacamensis]|uniref:Tetratricopeptide repeat protein n=1 Tax=Lentzea atacamensis TaxID=531938 RepID=A0ABX9EGL1_9PSEU|nr:FxSxx-COOH system tetratricopeptide repeat protein [Lentzea atacamensis]RAS70320.1 tetratricopeptide repeat protein [Lentzea atacamensis]